MQPVSEAHMWRLSAQVHQGQWQVTRLAGGCEAGQLLQPPADPLLQPAAELTARRRGRSSEDVMQPRAAISTRAAESLASIVAGYTQWNTQWQWHQQQGASVCVVVISLEVSVTSERRAQSAILPKSPKPALCARLQCDSCLGRAAARKLS